MKRDNVVDFHTYRALKNKPYVYGGVLPPYVADTLREQIIQLRLKHDAISKAVKEWEIEYMQMTQDVEHCLRIYELLPKNGLFTIDDALIDKDGHIFWHESGGGNQ